MQVSEAMSRNVRVAEPAQSLRDAARMIADLDAGVLPVGDNDRLIGMITDRDITIRAVAEGKGPDTTVDEVMTPEVRYCFEDDDLEQVARNMADLQVRRMPVMNREKRLVGILSIGDIAVKRGGDTAGDAESGVARPGGSHSQSAGECT